MEILLLLMNRTISVIDLLLNFSHLTLKFISVCTQIEPHTTNEIIVYFTTHKKQAKEGRSSRMCGAEKKKNELMTVKSFHVLVVTEFHLPTS